MEYPWRLPETVWLLLAITLPLQLVAGLVPLLLRGVVNARRLWIAALAVGLVTTVGMVLGAGTQHGGFASMSVAWLAVAIIVPTCGAAVLTVARKRATGPVRAAAWLGLGCLVPAIWASVIEPRRLTIERATVELAAARKPARPLLIGVLADIQTTGVFEHERDAVRAVMAASPDLILIPGDVVQLPRAQWPEKRDEFVALFQELKAPLGVYAVAGDIDRVDVLHDLCVRSDVRYLDNEVVELEHAGRPIALLGLNLDTDRKTAMAHYARRDNPGEIRLVFAHRPRVVLNIQRADRVDLVIAGHTHGGQVQIPGFGPPIDLSPLPSHVTGGGLSEVEGTRIYVSRGVGMERGSAPRVRLFCPPEVSLLELR